ncbi:unnamed protein product [Pleuronectes platessa]|uniref:Uncharacterized protein n=1 Tax=Pleuronectes platessa TaxID=8262 RepID=A0A9N7UKU0_PLEPL|nr:unnamed protein product [Pleuronectes platessa]
MPLNPAGRVMVAMEAAPDSSLCERVPPPSSVNQWSWCNRQRPALCALPPPEEPAFQKGLRSSGHRLDIGAWVPKRIGNKVGVSETGKYYREQAYQRRPEPKAFEPEMIPRQREHATTEKRCQKDVMASEGGLKSLGWGAAAKVLSRGWATDSGRSVGHSSPRTREPLVQGSIMEGKEDSGSRSSEERSRIVGLLAGPPNSGQPQKKCAADCLSKVKIAAETQSVHMTLESVRNSIPSCREKAKVGKNLKKP